MRCKWGLMLGGGTALGALQVPIVRALMEDKGMFRVGAGTSIGANNLSMMAQGFDGLARLEDAWSEVDGHNAFQAFRFDIWKGIYSLRRLRRWHDRIGSCDGLHVPAYVGVVDLATQEHDMVLLNDLQLAERRDAVVASSQQPMINQGVQFQGRWYGDGGIVSVLGRLPDHELHDLDELHVVACSPVHRGLRVRQREQEEVNSAIEQGTVCFEMWTTLVAERDYEWLRVLAARRPGLKVVLYSPPSWEAVGRPFDARQATIRARQDLGRSMYEAPEIL